MLDSVAKQEVLPRELIVTDDLPSNSSYSYIREYSRTVSFEVIYKPNPQRLGLAANANSCLSMGTSEVLHCLQQDDYLLNSNVYGNLLNNFAGSSYAWSFLGGTCDDRVLLPKFTDVSLLGFNYMGGLSGLIQKNETLKLLDESLTQLTDVDLYERLYNEFGDFYFAGLLDIGYGFGTHQTGRSITRVQMELEITTVIEKHDIGLTRIFAGLDHPGFFDLRRDLLKAASNVGIL
jgi:hypothetical protein